MLSLLFLGGGTAQPLPLTALYQNQSMLSAVYYQGLSSNHHIMKHSPSLLPLPYIPYIHKGLMFQSVTLNIRAQFPSKGFELMRVHEVRLERVLHLMVRRHWYCIVIVFWIEPRAKTMGIIELIDSGEERESRNSSQSCSDRFQLLSRSYDLPSNSICFMVCIFLGRIEIEEIFKTMNSGAFIDSLIYYSIVTRKQSRCLRNPGGNWAKIQILESGIYQASCARFIGSE